MLPKGVFFLADTQVTVEPTAEAVAEMTLLAAEEIRRFGIEPKAALLSHSSFGGSDEPSSRKMRAALALIMATEPALEVAGKSWIPPILAQLLDDPYAAVRCVAERSLRQVRPSLIPAGYDYTLAPDARPPYEGLLLERWRREAATARDQSLPAETLVRLEDVTVMQEGFQRLIRQRDQRPVRLRE